MTRSQCCATYSYVRYSADYFDYFGIWHDGSRKTPNFVHITLQYATSNDSFFYVNLQVRGVLIFSSSSADQCRIAIKMIFRPVWPHQYCNGRINVQGVFMKRQREASQKMAELICSLAAQDMARKEALPLPMLVVNFHISLPVARVRFTES